MIKSWLKVNKTLRISEKLAILLTLASFVNILFPYHGILANEVAVDKNRENLGEFRRTVIYNPDKVHVDYEVAWDRYIPVTAYTSSIHETDSTPFTTATGAVVRNGIIACNFLPHGTLVRFPEYFGDNIFEVQDRMNQRYYYKADIWMKEKSAAKQFGKRYLKIEILKEQAEEPAIVTMK